MIQKLPIFPLNTVLFPGVPIQLHIFEERYRLMVGRCLEQRSPFGVVLIRSGSEVSPDDPWVRRQAEAAGDPELSALRRQLGGETTTYTVGTSAQISIGESTRLDDGRYYLVALGQRRFRAQYLVQRQPYYIASVAYLPEESPSAHSTAADQLRALYARYWQAIGAATGAEPPSDNLPEGVTELTYWMANRFQVDLVQKQRWLEADLATRLRQMRAAMSAELAMLPNSGPHQRERGGPWN